MRDLDEFESKLYHPRRSQGSSFKSSFLLDPRLRPRGRVEDDNIVVRGSFQRLGNTLIEDMTKYRICGQR